MTLFIFSFELNDMMVRLWTVLRPLLQRTRLDGSKAKQLPIS